MQGLQKGFLANVDYRMYTDNVDWEGLRHLKGDRFSPKAVNKTLFINQWDDAVVDRTKEAWEELGGRGAASSSVERSLTQSKWRPRSTHWGSRVPKRSTRDHRRA